MDGKLRVEQFSIQAGNWQQQPANMAIVDVSNNRARRNRGNLYILIEAPAGPVPQSLYGELMRTLTETYYGSAGSITRGLRAALLAANTAIFERNLRADHDERIALGVNCVVLREDDLYMGHIGPALTTLIQDGMLTRYPSDSVWLRGEGPSTFDLLREPPAGMRRDVEPNLFHVTLHAGDVLILSTTNLMRMIPAGELLEAITQRGAESARTRLEALANGRDLSAITIEMLEDRFAATEAPAATMAPLPRPPVGERPAPPPRETELSRPSVFAEPQQTALPEKAMPPLEEEFEPPQSAEARPQSPRADLGDRLSRGADRLRDGAEDLLLRVLPETAPEPPPPREQGLSPSGRALVLIALAIPLVILLLVILTRIQYERTRKEQLDNLRGRAYAQFDSAIRVQDLNAMRQGLREARSIAEEGLAIVPGDEAFVALQRRIEQKLNEIDVVEPLWHLWQLADLGEDAASLTDSSRIVIEGINIYVLNRGSDRVYRYLLNDVGDALQPLSSKPILLQKGEMRGGVRLGDMVDIAWLEPSGQRTTGAFVTLERAGSLLVYDPRQGVDVLPMANADTWLKPQAIACYTGNLYVLDPLLGRILKYVPVDNAYTSPPGDYLAQPGSLDLTGAVDMAIDGNIYVLFADGRIVKLYRGQPQPFSMAGLPSPMRNPTTIFVSGPKKPDGAGYIYVTDTGNERILQFDKNGNYIRQFRDKPGASYLKKLRGIYMDEGKSRMYILSGKTLWLTDIRRLSDRQPSR